MSTNNNFILPKKDKTKTQVSEYIQSGMKRMSTAMKEAEIEEYPALAAGTTQCPLCPTTCKETSSLRRHMLNVHKKRVPAGENGRPSTGGKRASDKRSYQKKKGGLIDSNKKRKSARSEKDAQRYREKKEKQRILKIAEIMKPYTDRFISEKVDEAKSARRLGHKLIYNAGDYLEELTGVMGKIFCEIGSVDSYYSRISLMEVIVDYLAKCYPHFINEKYDKNEDLFAYLSGCDKDNLEKLPLGEMDNAMQTTIKEFFLSNDDGLKYMVDAMIEVLNYLHLRFKQYEFRENSIRAALPFLSTLFKGPW